MNANATTITEGYLNSFHDAELHSVAIKGVSTTVSEDEKSIAVIYTRTDGTKAGFDFRDVVAFRTSGLLLQNVVSRILVSSVSDMGPLEVERIVGWVCSIEGGKVLVEPPILTKYVEQAASNELSLFYSDPSWGAEVAILCRHISPCNA